MQQASGAPRRKRLKVDIACQSCRSRKIKCDGIRPACGPCQKKVRLRQTCTFHDPEPAIPRSTLPVSSPVAVTSAEAAGRHSPTGRNPPSPRPGQPEVSYYGCAPAGFGEDVSDAIDAKLGLPSSQQPLLIPMTNAPLFGLHQKRADPRNADYGVDNVLPPRKRADYLVDVYWEHIHPLEPFLDRDRFTQHFQGLFAGTSLDSNERIFTSSLNIMFALSTQLHEDMPGDQREDAASAYFHRALTLLRPEYVLFETPSLDLVDCLLLMSRYLQCTNNPHQTWMVIGSAVRIAQSLGLHLPPRASTLSEADLRRRRNLWQFCVFMDRGVSWALGRPTMVHEPVAILPELVQTEESASSYCFAKILELYEIGNHVMLSQAAISNASLCSQGSAEKMGLPRLYRKEDPFSMALQWEGCLKKWEAGLPSYLKLDSPGDCDSIILKQRVMVRLRLLHGRIFMFRPMLARVCLPGYQSAAPKPALGSSLEDRLTQSCASLCVECAQEMVSVIQRYHNSHKSFGLLPWWQRLFYLHAAGTILIAAMLRADFYTPSVSNSLAQVMEALRAHEHLGPFIGQCVSSFQLLAGKIAKAHHPGADKDEGDLATSYFHDILQEDNFLAGMDDMAWLSNFESISGL